MFYFFAPCFFLCVLLFFVFLLFGKQENVEEKPISDNNTPQIKYDVFVSFRGKDIRDGFLSHLTEAFDRKKIKGFVDDKLEKGEEIWPSLVAAIERSAFSLIIFSPDYASSRWCLEEAVKIIECKEKHERIVIPVFYKVAPTDVRHQSGSYKNAFVKHGLNYKSKVQIWKDALEKFSDFSGIESSKFRNDAELVKEIVDLVLKRLDKPHVIPKGLVGIHKIAILESWISNELQDTRLIGIWGMGGIGKTTLADVLFNRLRSQYEGSYFLANERDQSNKHGTTPLKKIIFSKLLGEEVDIDTPNSLPENIVRRIACMKVLVVLDDVNDSDHIEKLLGSLDNFGMGSTVIVTTRDEQVLRINKVNKTYKLEEFSSDEALELFNFNAFSENDQEREEYSEISKLLVNYAQGNPLVIKVLAHLVHGRNKEEWEGLLGKLKKMLPKEVYEVMKVSYDILDHKGKQIFLDLACFFLRLHVPVTVSDLKSLLKDNESDNSVTFELRRLEDKALITISEDNIISMHDSLQEMAWEIVRQESTDDPGSRSRLWDHNDVHEALENNKVNEAIRSIEIKLKSMKKLKLIPQIFAMRRLKFLKISGIEYHSYHQLILAEGAKFMATELRFLCWENYPLKSLPESFNAEKLVILKLNQGKMEKLWDGVKNVMNLKTLDLKWCTELKELPDLSRAKRLEELYLHGCSMLTIVHSSIFSLPKLERLDLSLCYSLVILVSNSPLLSLRYLDLKGCENLKKFSLKFGNMKELKSVQTRVEALPSSFGDQVKLESLYLGETEIRSLPELPPFLVTLDVQNCKLLKTLPKLPLALKTLNVSLCSLQSLVELPQSLETLATLGCPLQTLPELPPYLKTLCVSFCTSLQTLPKLPSLLKTLNIGHCSSLQSLPNLPLSLETLDARNCKSLRTVLFPSTAVQQLKENRKLVLLPDSVRLDEHSTAATGLNAKINLMKFANEHLSAPNRNRVKTYGYSDVHSRSDRCVYMYPGSSVPEWLEYSTREDCLIIDLSSAPPSRKLGFIFCFILDMSCIRNIHCRITIFNGEDEGKIGSVRMYIDYGLLGIASNHVCMMIYDQTCSEFLSSRAKNQTKFKIQVKMEEPDPNTRLPKRVIQKYGVRQARTVKGSSTKAHTITQQVLQGFGVSPIRTSSYKTFTQQIELCDSRKWN